MRLILVALASTAGIGAERPLAILKPAGRTPGRKTLLLTNGPEWRLSLSARQASLGAMDMYTVRRMLTDDPAQLVSRLLDVVENDIVPLTRAGVRQGDKLFGGAVLRKDDGALVIAGTNLETECPLWHGEIATIKALYELPPEDRPAPTECLFLSTHEPCSMCLSAITWAGFDNFYYLFSYEDSRDDFAIPHDLRILKEIFGCSEGAYVAENAYWKSHDIVKIAESLERSEQDRFGERIAHLRTLYAELSEIYQRSKDGSDIPLA